MVAHLRALDWQGAPTNEKGTPAQDSDNETCDEVSGGVYVMGKKIRKEMFVSGEPDGSLHIGCLGMVILALAAIVLLRACLG